MSKKFSIAWTAPANDGGAAITDYEIGLTPSGGSETVTSHGSTTPPHEITGLTDLTSYGVRVRAVNSQGAGAWSSVSSRLAWLPSEQAGLEMWLDPSDATTITSDANGVSALADISGNGHNLSMTTNANKPATSTINGLSAIDFTNRQSALVSSSLVVSPDVMVFLVLQGGSIGTSTCHPFDSANDIADRLWARILSDGSYQALTRNIDEGDGNGLEQASSATGLATLSPHILCVHHAGTAANGSSLFLNGTSIATGTLGQERLNGLTLGNHFYYANGSNSFAGSIGEVLVFSSALTATQRQTVEGYLAIKWGTTGSLPAGHPYA